MSDLPPRHPYQPGETLPYATAHSRTPTSGLAIASLVLGILGMCIPLLGIIAIVLASIAMSRTRTGGLRGRGMAIAGLVLGIVGTLFIILQIAILLPSLNRARETANRVKCASNMRQIGMAMLLYANENRGENPPDLATLLATQDLVPQTFTCPSSNSTGAATPFTSDIAARAAGNLDYIYTGEGTTNSIGADEPLLFEVIGDHNNGGNVLYGDGHVEFLVKAAYLKLANGLSGTPRLDAEEAAAINKP